jgi:hypothetical protein
MPDEVINREMACAVQSDARRTWRVVGWVIVYNHPDYAGKFAARLLSGHPAPYVLLDNTLSGLRAQLPPGLRRQTAKPQGAVEMWFAS